MAITRPIVLIPGIKGTKLVQTNRVTHDVIFSGLQMNFESIMDLELTPSFNRRHYDRRPDTIINPGELESVAYGEFVDVVGEDIPVFIFNYDWRLSLSVNGKRLRDFLEYLTYKGRAINKALQIDKRHEPVDFSSFNIVTHSMGNFIARNYLKDWGFELVDKIAFVAPPFRGALSLAEVVVTGQGLLGSTQAKIRKIIRTFPGALELLPHKPGYVTASVFDDGAEHDFFTLEDWQGSVKDQSNEWGRKFMDALAAAADAVQNELLDLDQLEQAERNRILVIARHGGQTMQAITVYRDAQNTTNYMDFKHGCRTPFGDEEVAHASSCCFHDSVLTLMLTDKTGFWNAIGSALTWERFLGPHAMIMADDRVQSLVRKFFDTDAAFGYRIPGDTIRPVVGLQKIPCDSAPGHVQWVPTVDDVEDKKVLLKADE